MSSNLGIVIPAYKPDIERLRVYVRSLDERLSPESIRIELDAPMAGVSEALSDLPATINAVNRRRGKGAAITVGFEALDTDVRAFVDGDGSTAVGSVADVTEPVQEGQTNLAVGSRRHLDARVTASQTFVRRQLGDNFVRLARRLLAIPLYDYQCGAKAISAETWSAVREHIRNPRFAWDVELIAIVGALNGRITEVAIEWVNHPSTTLSPLGTSVEMFHGLLMARYRAELVRRNRLRRFLGRSDTEPLLVDRISEEQDDLPIA